MTQFFGKVKQPVEQFIKIRKTTFFLILSFIAFELILYRGWIFNSVVAYSDWGFAFPESLVDFQQLFTWQSSFLPNYLGGFNLILWRLIPGSLTSIFAALDIGVNTSNKFVYFLPFVILSFVGSYFLVREITRSQIGAIVGAIVFSLNSYFLTINTQGHILISIAASFLPLSILFFIRLMRTEEKRYMVSVAIFLLLTSSYDLRIFYVSLIVLFLYYLYYLLIMCREKTAQSVLHITIVAAGPIILTLILNIFWILPFFSSNFLEGDIFTRSLFGNSFWSLSSALTLFHPFWNGNAPKWFSVQEMPLYYWIIPISAVLGYWVNKKNSYYTFFGILALLGIFLSKQSHLPVEYLYEWLFKNIPGFNAFREASKFYIFTIIGYSVFIGGFVSWIWQKKIGNIPRWFFTLIIIAPFVWNAIPLLTGRIGTLFIERTVPGDYHILRENLLQERDYSRILWLPIASRWSPYSDSHPRVSLGDMIRNDWDYFSLYKSGKIFPTDGKLTSILTQHFSNDLLDVSSIKYVIVPIQDIDNDDDFFKYYGERRFFIDELDKISYLKKIDIGTKDLVVYENENYRPHIYITKDQETIYNNIPFDKVDFQFKNPTQYHIYLKNISDQVYINFSEKYHSEWKLRIGDFHWFDVLTNKDYFLADTFHFENDAKLNSFLIDPTYIRKNLPKNSYTENPDGSINLELTLYFKPQSYFYLGLIISSTTLFGCLGYLSYDFIKRWKITNNRNR